MEHVCIIAEAGVNHNGSFDVAKRMIDVAKDAGVDYVKFQTYNPSKLVTKYAEKARYQKATTGNDKTQLSMLQDLSLSHSDFISLRKYCDFVKIGFISTPFDTESILFLEKLDMDFWKIASGEITNLPYLEIIGRTKRKVVLSTGMSEIQEIQDAIDVLERNGTKEIVLLHCNTQYPTPYDHVNLMAINTLKNKFKKEVGYSDHSQGIEVPIAAVSIGATVIEKHFTLDKNMKGPDHKASLDPIELQNMVRSIRNIEKAMGNGKKVPSESELENRVIARKSIVASRTIKKGEMLTDDNITVKRPGSGISPMNWYYVLGKTAKRDFIEDEQIEI